MSLSTIIAILITLIVALELAAGGVIRLRRRRRTSRQAIRRIRSYTA